MTMSKQRSRPHPITIEEPDSFLPVLDFGPPPPKKSPRRGQSGPLSPPSTTPSTPRNKLKSNKKSVFATFLNLDPLQEVVEEEDGAILYKPPTSPSGSSASASSADANRKRVGRLWDFTRSSKMFVSSPTTPNSLKTVPIFSTSASNNNNNHPKDPFAFPLPPNTLPIRAEDPVSPFDADATFASIMGAIASPTSPSTMESGDSASCYSPLYSSTSSKFIPASPEYKPVLSIQVPAVQVSASSPAKSPKDVSPVELPSRSLTPCTITAAPRACPSPDLDPELSTVQSSSSSAHSSDNEALPSPLDGEDAHVSFGEEEEDDQDESPVSGVDEFRIIPRLFGSWNWDAPMVEQQQQPEREEDAHWDQAIDDIFSLVSRNRRPSAQSEYGVLAFDIPQLNNRKGSTCLLSPVPEVYEPTEEFIIGGKRVEPVVDEAVVRRLSEDRDGLYLKPSRSAPSPPSSPRTSTSADRPTRKSLEEVDRPLPAQSLPSESHLFSPSSSVFSPTAISFTNSFSPAARGSSTPFFAQPIDIDSWPTWTAFDPVVDRRPSASALSLISTSASSGRILLSSKFDDDDEDFVMGGLKALRKRVSSNTLASNSARSSVNSKSSAPPSAWYKRSGNTTTTTNARSGSALKSEIAPAVPSFLANSRVQAPPKVTVAPLKLSKDKKSPRAGAEQPRAVSPMLHDSLRAMGF